MKTRKTNALKWNRIPIYLLMGLVISFSACKNEEDPKVMTPVGSWKRAYSGDVSFTAQLNLSNEEALEWIVLDTISSHENSMVSFEISGNQLRVFGDPEIEAEGFYQWSISDQYLQLEVIDDPFAPRVAALDGHWTIKDPAVDPALVASWTKSYLINNAAYSIRLRLEADGSLHWEMIDPIPGHANSSTAFTTHNSTFVIYKDDQCGDQNGYYQFEVIGGELHLSAVKDLCTPRIDAISGSWSRL
ncbi:MAG: hypothetical protein KJ578_12330 [Bacteroidetes bacterium]|nr:hypothetical protein [Bacteroidota bacterium]MBU1578689.1 hypothetical protein [Bacteroidota bacterium]MBU2465052.1 hypothetical protein [Bacteroidota bacterium]MBU2558558.1 hypothetical protein [Bacteroidota bacterium]